MTILEPHVPRQSVFASADQCQARSLLWPTAHFDSSKFLRNNCRRRCQSPVWRIKLIGLIGRPRSRRSILEVRKPQHHIEPRCTNFSTDKNPKAFAYANPGKLQKQATRSHDACSFILSHHLQHLMNTTGQRKAPPCSSRRSPPCRTSSYHRCGRWSSRSWENHSHQISHQAVHQTYSLPPCWSSYRGHIQTPTSNVPRMSF